MAPLRVGAECFGRGLRRGMQVEQSQVIGYVGMTGLATGPHLHFEVLVNGKHRDPRVALRNVTGEPLAPGQRATFVQLKARLFALLDSQPANTRSAPSVASGGAGD